MMKKRLFLGGTCEGYDWRKDFINLIDHNKFEVFNPVVDNWDEEAQKRELIERRECYFCIYVITPDMKGVFSIAEVIDDSNKRPEKTIFVVVDRIVKHETRNIVEYTEKMKHSLDNVKKMVKRNGGYVFSNIDEMIVFLNNLAF